MYVESMGEVGQTWHIHWRSITVDASDLDARGSYGDTRSDLGFTLGPSVGCILDTVEVKPAGSTGSLMWSVREIETKDSPLASSWIGGWGLY